MEVINVGKWLSLIYKCKEMIGYIVEEDDYFVKFQPINPYEENIIRIYKLDTRYTIIELVVDSNMIYDLIDIALDVKDEEWFNELVEIKKTILHTKG